MTDSHSVYETLAFPGRRTAVLDTMDFWGRRHAVHALIEVDVSELLRRTAASRADGGRISLTACVISCVARAVAEQPVVQGIRGRHGLVVFKEVDVTTVIERDTPEGRVPVAHIVKRAEGKTAREIHDEVRSVQRLPYQQIITRRSAAFRLFDRSPRILRRVAYGILGRNPEWVKQHVGTVGVSAIGMFGRGSGFGLPVPVFPVFVTVGGVDRKPGVVGDAVAIRDYLCLTLSFDHDIVDGAPAARFTARLRKLIEKADIA